MVLEAVLLKILVFLMTKLKIDFFKKLKKEINQIKRKTINLLFLGITYKKI